ncbi:Forkhead box protein N3 [Schistosoma japonicum]|nr:Forkhead box protein N3 [Schistosoma japonicum]
MDKVHSNALYSDSNTIKSSLLNSNMTVINKSDPYNNGVSRDAWSFKHSSDLVSPPSDLVSLAWLQNGDILQITPLDGEVDGSDSAGSTIACQQGNEEIFDKSPPMRSDSLEPPNNHLPSIVSGSRFPVIDTSAQRPASVSGDRFHSSEPPRFSSSSTVAVGSHGLMKPNYSYTHLIFMAIESTPQKCMTVNQIYNWCESNFPFYKHAGVGWKNSLRHNLSINKSFKRLPRDSRNESNILKCRTLDVLCSQRQEHEDLDDEEGPGRGAFWTVEPRERASLLDAIKRNPWNFANVAAIGCRLSDSSNSTSSASALPVRRFGLANSAPGHLLRAEGLGRDNIEGIVNDTSAHIRLLYTGDGQVLATYDTPFFDLSEHDVTGSTDGTTVVSSDVPLSDHRYWASPSEDTVSPDGAASGVEWPAEEEEKYLDTLRLLNETGDITTKVKSPTTENLNENLVRSSEAKHEALESFISAHILDDTKLVTKQKRKSRLLPTRMSKCNECKENVSGCESCIAKRSEVLNSSYVRSALREYDLDISNMLDCDQEPGPAGGPLVRTAPTKNLKSVSPIADANDSNPDKCDKKPTNPETLIYLSDEVYVTPPPYIDHEYSHCQAQLRRPEENQLVNKFNDNYFSNRLTELMHLYPLLKAFVDSILLDSSVVYDTDGFDDGFSSPEHDIYSEEGFEGENHESMDSSSPEISDCEYAFCKRSSRRQHPGSMYCRARKTRLSRISSRGSRKRRGAKTMKLFSSLNSYPTRRSKRIIRAPRRPYDEFEKSQCYDYEFDDESGMIVDRREVDFGSRDRFNVIERYSQHSTNNHSDSDSENSEKFIDIETSRSRKHNYYRSLKHTHAQSHSGNINRYWSPNMDSYVSSDEHEENYLRTASTLQVSSSHPLNKHSQTNDLKSSLDVSDTWTSMKWSVEQKINKSSINCVNLENSHGSYEHERVIQKEYNEIQNCEEILEEPVIKRKLVYIMSMVIIHA